MAANSLILSQTLESITIVKIQEQEKKRSAFEAKKHSILGSVGTELDVWRRVAALLNGVSSLKLGTQDERLKNMHLWLDQAKYDPFISHETLETFEAELHNMLNTETRRLELADLNSKLLLEWLNPPAKTIGTEEIISEQGMNADDPFAIVENDRLQELRGKFEAVVFQSKVIDEAAIENYLSQIFQGDERQNSLVEIRKSMDSLGNSILTNTKPFNIGNVQVTMEGIISHELLSEQKKTILQGFIKDHDVLREISDVLNMRFANLTSWTWEAGPQGIPVEPRRQLNGKWRIMMDEDILQAVFLHHVGNLWCDMLGGAVTDEISRSGILDIGIRPSQADLDEREFFLGERSPVTEGIASRRAATYDFEFLLAQLRSGGYEEDVDGSKRENKESIRLRRQMLLKLLATELIMHQALNGEAAIVQSDMQWFGSKSSLPGSTADGNEGFGLHFRTPFTQRMD